MIAARTARERDAMGSANRLKLGLFSANSSSGRAVTTVPERWSGNLKRYRDAGVEEIALLGWGRTRTERDVTTELEQMAREFVESAARL
jgi:hypothetical protein